MTVTGRRVDGYRWIPGRISNSVPQPLTGSDAANELAYWTSLQPCAALSPLTRSVNGDDRQADGSVHRTGVSRGILPP